MTAKVFAYQDTNRICYGRTHFPRLRQARYGKETSRFDHS